ncbi:MAG: metallophosphoesterase family protein [Planctomycetota bacterium]
MRTLAIGDIHGCYTALTTLERCVPIGPDDRVVGLGDYVDRGPSTRAVLDWLIARKGQGSLVPLRGNHELMMCAAREDPKHCQEWLAYGGGAALRSYSPFGDAGKIVDVPEGHWQFMERLCLPYFETDTHFFVHANAFSSVPLGDQPAWMLYWEPFNDPPPHESGKIMICGHTPQTTGVPRSIGHAVCIDTKAHAGGWLTCLNVENGDYWQARETGETRRGRIEADR